MGREPWFRASADAYREVQRKTLLAFPEMRFAERNNRAFLEGPFPLIHKEKEVERFEIEVGMPEDFPVGVPKVREVVGKIKRDEDHHTRDDGELCLFVPGERWMYWPVGSTLVEFLTGPVKSFLIGVVHFERLGEWPFGQWGHREKGIYQAYSKMWDIALEDRAIIADRLKILAFSIPAQWRKPCPCGRRERFGRCHGAFFQEWRGRITIQDAREALSNLNLKSKK